MTSRGISLANKCQLLFGLAVILILTAALSVPWLRMQRLVDEGQREIAKQLADAWLTNVIQLGSLRPTGTSTPASGPAGGRDPSSLVIHVRPMADAELRADRDPFLARAIDQFRRHVTAPSGEAESSAGAAAGEDDRIAFEVEKLSGEPVRYRFARALSVTDIGGVQDPAFAQFSADAAVTGIGDPLWGVLVIERSAATAMRQLFINRMYIILSGMFAGALATLVFYFITTRLILSPVRVLRETAHRVSLGDLHVRSDIATGDEFEDLSNTFNMMLGSLKSSQDQLRLVNKGLDLKVNELAASNVLLNEANRLKSEFIANVSHELRTPLNSILGFAEIIAESAGADPDAARSARLHRFASNILISAKSLLELINDLLDLAKIEAGRMEVQVEPTSVADVCEGLATLIRPQAEKKNLTIELAVSPALPMVDTDPAKFQQIIFNFLANAVKFTPEGGRITVSAARLRPTGQPEVVRVGVADTGPGISAENQKVIFEKFRQLDSSHTRQHAGSGLGLSICRELAALLGGRIEVESEVGKGATFALVLPVKVAPEAPAELIPARSE